jgi:predicted nuclease of predicted toxin-antitoxin system
VEEQPALGDIDVLNVAISNDALLVTEDKDFGELVFRLRLNHSGVLLVRIEDKDQKIEQIALTIAKKY